MSDEKNDVQHHLMTNGALLPLLLRLSLPAVIGLAVTALYSLADAFFVSALGRTASAAVGVCFSIQVFTQAIGYTLGMGAGSHISRLLGKKDVKRAESFAVCAFWGSVFCGIAVIAVGFLMGDRLLSFLGANQETLPFARSYARYLFFSAPFLATSLVVSQLLRAEGKALFAMTGLVIGSLFNILFDYIFIKHYNMGVAGASIATCISQAIGLVVLLLAYWTRSSNLQLLKKPQRSCFKNIGAILFTGMPSAFRQGLMSLATILLNRIAADWGEVGIGALSVVSRLFLLFFSLCLGIGQGLMPIAGYNYGAGKYKRVKSAYRQALLFSIIASFAMIVPILIFTPQLISFLQNDPEVVRIAGFGLRLQILVLLLHGPVTCTIMLLQAIGKPVQSATLACARQGLFFLPIVWIFPRLWGAKSVLWIQPCADLLAFLFAVPFAFYVFRHLKQQSKGAV